LDPVTIAVKVISFDLTVFSILRQTTAYAVSVQASLVEVTVFSLTVSEALIIST
jgi:hypothetical protein